MSSFVTNGYLPV
ncbi:RNA polymerase subunit RPO18, partial [Monkeypox virus]